MTQNDLNTLLSDYMTPTADQGFSDALMQKINAEGKAIDLSDYTAAASRPWRSWIIALTLGIVAGLIWTWLGLSLPDLPKMNHDIGLLNSGLGLYAMAAICMAASLVYVGVDTA